jgi:hypothetical protein
LQHIEGYVLAMRCLHTCFSVAGETLSEDPEERDRSARAALGPLREAALDEMAHLWWARERYARVLVGRPLPTHIDDVSTLVEEAEHEAPPDHLAGRALPAILDLAERYLRALCSA